MQWKFAAIFDIVRLVIEDGSRWILAVLVVVASPFSLVAAPPNKLKFEVVSVKRCTGPGAGREGQGGAGNGGESPGRMKTPCVSLADNIDVAYVKFEGGTPHFQGYPVKIEGLPAWTESERYSIEAKAEGTPGRGMMLGPMLQSVLEDRFALRIHSETRQGPAYALTVARGGFKLQPFRGGCTPVDPQKPPEPIRDEKTCRPTGQQRGSNVTWDNVMNLDSFAMYLGNASGLGAPVINKSGITGNFHIHIEYASDLRPGDRGYMPPTDDAPFPSVFTAVQQQLGLKLEATKGPHRFLIVDHVERPSAN